MALKLKVLFVGVCKNTSTNSAQAKGLECNGCRVIRYEFRQLAAEMGIAQRDIHLINTVRKEKPDFMIISKGNTIINNTVLKCRYYTKVYLWFMDAFLPSQWDADLTSKIIVCDGVFCDKHQAVREGLKLNPNTKWLCEGFDSDVDFPQDVDKKYDVSFIGNVYGHREHILRLVRAMPVKAFYKEHARVVSQSRINLNICTERCASDRVYKIMATGGFLLTDDWDGREQMFEDGKHLVIWHDIDDLLDKLDYYLHNPKERQAIALQGYDAVQPYSRKNWAKHIIDFHVLSRQLSRL